MNKMTKEEVIQWAKKEGYKDKGRGSFEKEGDTLIITENSIIRKSKDCMNERINLHAGALLKDLEIKDSKLSGGWVDIK